MPRRLTLREGPGALREVAAEWDALAVGAGSPFLLTAWLEPFCEAFGIEPVVAELREHDGGLAAGLVLQRIRGGLEAVANDHTGDWDAVAADPAAHAELWQALAASRPGRLHLLRLRSGPAADTVRAALSTAGLAVVETPELDCPYLELPGDFDQLLAARSSNTRSQWRRRRRNLEREGELALRVVTGGPDLDAELDALFAVEASGWKARNGTAIVSSPDTERLYRGFAHRLADAGLLRVYLLELDGRLLAGDLGCALDGVGFLVKTGFDEAAGRLSPGLVLRGEVLRASIEEGLRGYDFLGRADDYKTRWTGDVRPRVRLDGTSRAEALWRARLRPALAAVKRRIR